MSARLQFTLSFLIVLPLLYAWPVQSAERTSSSQPSRNLSGNSAATQDASDSVNASSPDTSAVGGDAEMGHDSQPLTPNQAELGAKIRRALAMYEPKHLNARDNSSWEVMHGLIAFGPRTEIFRDGPGGTTVNAMGWLCWGARCQGAPLIVLENEHPHALYGVGLEGHDGQYLAMLAQWRVRPESPMHIGGKDFNVGDLIEEEKVTCQSGTELTFKLIALAHYLPSDAEWTSRNGEKWNIPKLIKAEIQSPINGATCGGSHRLLGIANAVKERTKRNEPIDGQWARAAKYISDYQRYTLGALQNADGSFSTEWFNYAADRPGNIDRKLQTTGHMLEFLVWSLPTDQLRDPRVIRAVDFLSGELLANPDRAWSVGPLGHALHALVIYHERLYNEPALPSVPQTAAVPLKTKAPTISDLSPPEPECEFNANGSVSQLQRTADGPKATLMADEPRTATAKEVADRSDGCTDAIPPTAARASVLHLALRDIISAIAPQGVGQSPITLPVTTDLPRTPTDAPFDRPGTTEVGP
ncbi:MAG TPA: hypothetical protein VGJ04_05120 [Pirellulales bacterium]